MDVLKENIFNYFLFFYNFVSDTTKKARDTATQVAKIVNSPLSILFEETTYTLEAVTLIKRKLRSIGTSSLVRYKREVKMAGYWPSSFFAFFMDRDEVEVHKNAKKNEANIQPS